MIDRGLPSDAHTKPDKSHETPVNEVGKLQGARSVTPIPPIGTVYEIPVDEVGKLQGALSGTPISPLGTANETSVGEGGEL